MAGGNHSKSLSHKAPSSSTASSHRKSRWESPGNVPAEQKPKPSPQHPSPAEPKLQPDSAHAPFPSPGPPFPFSEPFPPPAYGFHMLDRRTIVLADGSVRSYFALPPDYDFTPRHSFLRPEFDNRFPRQFSPETAGFRETREYWNKSNGGPDGPAPGPTKRKYGVDEEKERQFLMPHANPNRDRLGGTSGPFGEEMRAAKYMRTTGAGAQCV